MKGCVTNLLLCKLVTNVSIVKAVVLSNFFFFGENACVENASVNKTNGEKGPSCTVSYLFGRRPPGYGPGGEGELQVIAPLIPVNIEQLSGKEKPRYKFRFQGFWVYFR